MSRNQKQNSANTKRIVGHALTSNPYIQGHLVGKKLQFSPVANNLGPNQQPSIAADPSSATHNNFPAISAVRTSHNNGLTASANANTIGAGADPGRGAHHTGSKPPQSKYNQQSSGSNRQNRLLLQNTNQQLLNRNDAAQQFQGQPHQGQTHQGSVENSRLFSGSSQTRDKPGNMPLNNNL